MKTLVNQAISQFLETNQSEEVTTNLCECGAITMSASSEICFLKENAPFIGATNTSIYSDCNRCVNGWGIDAEETEEEEDQL